MAAPRITRCAGVRDSSSAPGAFLHRPYALPVNGRSRTVCAHTSWCSSLAGPDGLWNTPAIPAHADRMFDHIRADFRRYHDARRGARLAFVAAAFEYGFLATLVYRYGRWTRTIRPRLLSYPFKLAYVVLRFFVHVLFGIDISTNAAIGPGLYIGHFGGIFLHGDMGRNCNVGQGVTIGFKGAGKSGERPRVGDDVYIGAGAFVIGAIRVGDRVVIGANTTVVKDVPDGHVIVSAETRAWPRGAG